MKLLAVLFLLASFAALGLAESGQSGNSDVQSSIGPVQDPSVVGVADPEAPKDRARRWGPWGHRHHWHRRWHHWGPFRGPFGGFGPYGGLGGLFGGFGPFGWGR